MTPGMWLAAAFLTPLAFYAGYLAVFAWRMERENRQRRQAVRRG